MITLYLYLLVALVALVCCWRTIAVLSLLAVAASVMPHKKVAQR